MNNIVDLSVFENQTLDIKMPDGKILKITKPVQRMVIEILKFKNLNEDTPPRKIIEATNRMVWNILNSNDESLHITQADVAEGLNTQSKLAIIQAYSTFITGIQSDPN